VAMAFRDFMATQQRVAMPPAALNRKVR